MKASRDRLIKARCVVVKVGSRSLAELPELPERLAEDVAALGAEGRRLTLVSSGAIAIGAQKLAYENRPREMAKLQAAAAVGQVELMRRYESAFARHNLVAAQILLTHADLANRERLNNARAAIAELLDAGGVPIVNENDTVAVDEIRFGDNDQLASMVTPLVEASLLVLLTDVAGILDESGSRIGRFDPGREVLEVKRAADDTGSGGIKSKIDAARKANRAGADVVIASAAERDVVRRIVAGEDLGTFVPAPVDPLGARKHWIFYTLRPKGVILVDPGAAQALRAGKSSLLPVGVRGIRGQFSAGDAVTLIDPHDIEVGRGLCRLSSGELARAAGKNKGALAQSFGPAAGEWLVVHRDDMVLTRKTPEI